ncbi:hypothetical protein CLV46_1036 [Diaminobutyricimonas aerilata]|uniref:SnoaL-like protein n=1 Tax=Diaminobutyricimonas aerilata TaxID=1162967 RepID=A0A2M9CHX0_9MICO|nr:hypothetical protein [Diaminobutyricimonas aerilata]PJJ71487.1 hypothetical protein CLV46_1036 [Diaminobutyricimonas aerilata]
MISDREPVDLTGFFHAYARASLTGDAHVIAGAHGPGYVESAPSTVEAWIVDDEYREAVAMRSDGMSRLGVVDVSAEVLETTPAAPHHVLARVAWTLRFDRAGETRESRFEITYLVRLVEYPLILVAMSHEDEDEVMRRDGLL